MVSLSAVLLIMVRALPRVAEEPKGEGRGFLDRWAHSQLPEKIDAFLNGFLLKFLRKLKVFVLRLDNAIAKHLQKVKLEAVAEDRRANIDFKEIAGQNKESEVIAQ